MNASLTRPISIALILAARPAASDQIGAINEALPKPFITVVIDDGNNRLAGVPVTFTVQQRDNL